MKTPLLITTALTATLASTVTFADDDCRDPVVDWQPRAALRQQLEAKGWEVRRIKIDDGCYEVKGLDPQGRRVEAEFSPASLRLRELEIEDDDDDENDQEGDSQYGDQNDGRDRASQRSGDAPGRIVSGRPQVRVE